MRKKPCALRAEVRAPLRDAVRLVHDDKRDAALALQGVQELRKSGPLALQLGHDLTREGVLALLGECFRCFRVVLWCVFHIRYGRSNRRINV